MSPRLLTKMFVVVDIACFGTQVAGGIMSGSDDMNEASQGKTLITVGLVLQIIAFAFFVTWTAIFHKRMASASFNGLLHGVLQWQKYLYALYAISLLFVVRNITRLLEYNEGPDSPMLSNEAYIYALEAFTMLFIVAVFLVLHPGRLRMKARKFARKGYTEGHFQLEENNSK
jgi:hypothetical protein